MSRYVAFFRGVNVGGKHKIKMADLKQSLEGLGFTNVETLLQSGNIIFEADAEERVLKEKIEAKIEADFGFFAAAVLRQAEEMAGIIANCPFSPEQIAAAEKRNSEGESLYVQLFNSVPEAAEMAALTALRNEEEDFCVLGRDLYLLLRRSIRHSKIAAKLQCGDHPATARNWKTLRKIAALAEERTTGQGTPPC